MPPAISMLIADLNHVSNNENKRLSVGNKNESREQIQMEMEMEFDFRMIKVFVGQLLYLYEYSNDFSTKSKDKLMRKLLVMTF